MSQTPELPGNNPEAERFNHDVVIIEPGLLYNMLTPDDLHPMLIADLRANAQPRSRVTQDGINAVWDPKKFTLLWERK